jgi:uncharacterized protein (TIGR02145 family)
VISTFYIYSRFKNEVIMNKIKLVLLAAMLLAAGALLVLTHSNSISSSSNVGGSCDIEDYKTVKIGNQIWMAENSNCYINGSKCYDNDTANCAKYGRLYNWSMAMALTSGCNGVSCAIHINAPHRGICPSGWHIPSNAEWDALYRFADGINVRNGIYDSPSAGRYLKATNGWNNGGNGENTHGFSALPGGAGYPDGHFEYIGDGSSWWSASEDLSDRAYSRALTYKSGYAGWLNYSKNNFYSVRCVQD